MAKIYVDKKRLSLANQSAEPLPVIVIKEDDEIIYANEVKINNGVIKYVNPCSGCGSVFIESSDYGIIS